MAGFGFASEAGCTLEAGKHGQMEWPILGRLTANTAIQMPKSARLWFKANH